MSNKIDGDLDPLWDDLDWAIGQMLIMGWNGTEVTPQIRHLIEEHHLGSVLLTAKNLKSAHETAKLVQELQTIAHNAGHPYPLLIALDQENGGVNSLFDEDYICQFPSAMGIAAAGSPELAYTIAKATATEISACGVNMILGPVLDVLTNARYQPLGVRATSDDPQEVSQYSIAAMKGYKDAGLSTCGKHFPSYGNLDFLGSNLDIPIITQTLEELSLSAIVPFRNAIATGNLDAMFVGGCGIANPSMNISHACLSEQVVDDLLRNELGFRGVAISECLEMEALSHEIGVKGGTVMAVEAGCDVVMLCRAYDVQLEAIAGLKLGYANGILTRDRIFTSLRRVLHTKSGCTSWAQALKPPGISLLSRIHPSHLALSRKAYDDSITVMRDRDRLLPLSHSMHQREELLLLTPLVKPLPASSATKTLENKHLGASSASASAAAAASGNGPTSGGGPGGDTGGGGAAAAATSSVASRTTIHDRWSHRDRSAIMSGEGVFRSLGRSLARTRHGKLLHTSYTANGVRPVHENLIHRASTIIIVTADANRNLYQAGFTKHVAMMCSMQRASGQNKSLIVVAVSSPYDFAMDKTIGTYVCTFDFTEMAMNALVRALFGEFSPSGTLPGTLRKSKKVLKSRRNWLVETYNRDRDGRGLDELLQSIARASGSHLQYLRSTTASSFELVAGMNGGGFSNGASSDANNIEESHLVVSNSSTQALYGFCATYFIKSTGTGILGGLFVDPTKRNVSVGRSLHRAALRLLAQKPGITRIQLGSCFPGVFPGIPVVDDSSSSNAGSTGNTPTGNGGGAAAGASGPGSTTSGAGGSSLRSWFARSGWEVAFPRRITNMAIHDLNRWSPPEGLTRHLANAGISFDLIQGPEIADGVMSHVGSLAGPEVVELYRFVLSQGNKSCAVVRAKLSVNGGAVKTDEDSDGAAHDDADSLLGTVVVCSPGSPLATYLPVLNPLRGPAAMQQSAANAANGASGGRSASLSTEDSAHLGMANINFEEATGGIVAPVIAGTATTSASLILQGLAMMAVRQNKNHRAVRSVLSWVADDAYEALLAMQFEVLQSFDELANAPENVSPFLILTVLRNDC
ncbi:glycoside hydrolase family 3 protein [Ophiostoma piceae UAMH 11346]|uniref:Glycoside hydrolase family 3 protein n=1 Tax=Ophiostoma piceae (strain UAMH 11346) TaxID=1262450 RepID=S3C090_OPHP1|nr:glycoside hydrolase family 3 protein [Ophiostoma piceae UAMH 11346]